MNYLGYRVHASGEGIVGVLVQGSGFNILGVGV